MKLARSLVGAAFVAAVSISAAAAQPGMQTIRLQAEFQPDPHRVEVHVDGTDLAEDRFGGDCIGFVAADPTAQLQFTGGRSPLYISVESEVDAVLVVRMPSGEVSCNDDRSEASLNPGIEFDRPESGTYSIWVGKFSDTDDGTDGYLTFSEVDFPD